MKLFNAFVQADPSTTRKFGGTGLGLLLSKRLSETLGGGLILEWSELGQGSIFVAKIQYLPVASAILVSEEKPGFEGELGANADEKNAILHGLKVLVVDDSSENRTLLNIYLKRTGAEVLTAEDGQIGIEKVFEFLPDVVLMDIQMPRVDGHEAMRTLRAQGFSKPIVALTAHAMREERDRCFESGCTDYLTKPIDKEKLIQVLSRYLIQK